MSRVSSINLEEATGEKIATVSVGSSKDVDIAVEAARKVRRPASLVDQGLGLK